MIAIACSIILFGLILTAKTTLFSRQHTLFTKLVSGLYIVLMVLHYRFPDWGWVSFAAMPVVVYLAVVVFHGLAYTVSQGRAFREATTNLDPKDWLRRSIEGNEHDIIRQSYLLSDDANKAEMKRLYNILIKGDHQ